MSTTQQFLRSIARPSDTVLSADAPNMWTTAIDTSFGRITRRATISGGGVRIEFGHEYADRKGNPTTFGHEAEISVTEPWGSAYGSEGEAQPRRFAAEASQSAIGMVDPLTAQIRALLYMLAAAEAAAINERCASFEIVDEEA